MKNGKISQAALDRSVLRPLSLAGVRGEDARPGADSAAWQMHSPEGAVCVCSGSLGGAFDLSEESIVMGALNNLSASGASARGLVISLTMPEDAEEADLKKIMEHIAALLKELHLCVLGGDTRVSDALSRPLLSVTALGERMDAGSKKRHREDLVGKAIVMTGKAAQEGCGILTRAFYEELSSHLPAAFLDSQMCAKEHGSIVKEAQIAFKEGAFLAHDVSEGGVFAALWELGEISGCGFEVDLKAIPIRQETIEICEVLDVNPYQLHGQGALLIITDSAERLMGRLKEAGISSAVIGYTTGENARMIRNLDEVRYLEKPQSDPLRQIKDRR